MQQLVVLHLHKSNTNTNIQILEKGCEKHFLVALGQNIQMWQIFKSHTEYLSRTPDLDLLASYSTAVKSDQVARFIFN